MLTSSDVYEKNVALARQINREVRTNPASPYADKWVGIVDEQVAAVTDTLTSWAI
jgi:hypothetical protein